MRSDTARLHPTLGILGRCLVVGRNLTPFPSISRFSDVFPVVNCLFKSLAPLLVFSSLVQPIQRAYSNCQLISQLFGADFFRVLKQQKSVYRLSCHFVRHLGIWECVSVGNYGSSTSRCSRIAWPLVFYGTTEVQHYLAGMFSL